MISHFQIQITKYLQYAFTTVFRVQTWNMTFWYCMYRVFYKIINLYNHLTCTKIYTADVSKDYSSNLHKHSYRYTDIHCLTQEVLAAFSKQILCSLPEFYSTTINPSTTRHFLINLSRPDIVFALMPSFRFRGNHYERKDGLYLAGYLTREVQTSYDTFPN